MKKHGMFDFNGFCSITVPTIYNAIRYGIINVKITDTRRMKERTKYSHHEKVSLPASKIPYSIEIKPEEVNNRHIFGHFELDTVIGKRNGKHECLLTITERKSRYEMIFKIESKTSETVTNKINQIKEIAKWMNNYPRKILNYKTHLEVLHKQFDNKSILNKIYKLPENVNCYL